MSLTTGRRVGPYEMIGTLGAGGMGEVYRARDTRLKRDVALKIFPESFAADAERLARFQREAEVLASLNHPNIAQIYGFEESPAEAARCVRALVLELVDGGTLADRIARGPILVDEALPIARQIAEALEAAHERSVIHRDLKPSNVAFTREGQVKVLDFGLAKLTAPSAGSVGDVSRSIAPTITSPALVTGIGALLGTAAYMSPEQAKGREADKRSDIWAFGCVLYEMLTGRRAFEGEDVSDTLAAVLRTEPDWNAIATMPARIRHALRRCLHKDPKERMRDIGDVRLALDGAFETVVSQAAESANLPGHPLWRKFAASHAAALFLGSTLAAGAVWFVTRPEPPLATRTEITVPAAAALDLQGSDADIAITPDGSRIVYRASSGLFVRSLNQLEPTALAGTNGARGVFVSPDGQWVGFFDDDDNSLKRIPVTGGQPVTVVSGTTFGSRGATWGSDGTIVYATQEPSTGLLRVPAGGGEPTVLTTPDRAVGEGDHFWPEFLPGTDAVLFTVGPRTGAGGLDESRIAVLDLRSNRQTVLVRGGSHARYFGTGHLVYGADDAVRAVPFDLRRLALVGTSAVVLDEIATPPSGPAMAVSSTGTLVYALGGRGVTRPPRSVVWVDRDGREEPIGTIKADDYGYVRISSDRRSVLAILRNDLWIYDIVSGRQTRLTRDGSVTAFAWNSTGSQVAYTSSRGGEASFNVWVQSTDGSDDARQVTKLNGIVDVDSWSPDGRTLAVHHHRADGSGTSMLMLRMDEDGAEPEIFVGDEFNAEGATFSPDGRYVAYSAEEAGQREVYIRAYPRSGGRTTVSVGGGREVTWGRNGELFYRTLTGQGMAIKIATQPGLSVGDPVELSGGRYFSRYGGAPRASYDVTSDGRRFLALLEVGDRSDDATQPRLVVVQNWLSELRRLVPAD